MMIASLSKTLARPPPLLPRLPAMVVAPGTALRLITGTSVTGRSRGNCVAINLHLPLLLDTILFPEVIFTAVSLSTHSKGRILMQTSLFLVSGMSREGSCACSSLRRPRRVMMKVTLMLLPPPLLGLRLLSTRRSLSLTCRSPAT